MVLKNRELILRRSLIREVIVRELSHSLNISVRLPRAAWPASTSFEGIPCIHKDSSQRFCTPSLYPCTVQRHFPSTNYRPQPHRQPLVSRKWERLFTNEAKGIIHLSLQEFIPPHLIERKVHIASLQLIKPKDWDEAFSLALFTGNPGIGRKPPNLYSWITME